MERVIPVHEVAKLMRTGLEKAFECKIEFASEVEFFVVFYSHNDDVMSIRVAGEDYWLCNCERPQAANLLNLSRAMKNTLGFASVLQIKARWDYEEQGAKS